MNHIGNNMTRQQEIHYELSTDRMSTLEQRLRFAIEFSRMDLDTIRPGDSMNLREDLYLFAFARERFVPGNVFADSDEFGSIRELSIEDLKHLQIEARHALGECATVRVHTFSQPVTICLGISKTRIIRRNVLHVAGNPRDCFLTVLYFLLSQEPVGRIRVCPGCGEIFYKVKKQKYCSRRCGNRAYMREYRSTENGKDKESKENHKAYEKRTKKRTGKTVKVARRPRGKP
jgi:hypothetical protein